MTGLELSLRVGEIGDVARPFTEAEVRRLAPLALLVLERRLPPLVLTAIVLDALRSGRCPARGRAASRSVGPIVEAFVVLVTLDTRGESSLRRLHAAVRALEPVCLDAVEDLLSAFDGVRTVLEAERMYRAGLLSADWTFSLTGGVDASGRVKAQVHAHLRQDFAEA